MQETQQALMLDRAHFEYESEIRRLHDHLYGNANIRTPEGIAAEVVKVLKTLSHFKNGGERREFTPVPRDGALAAGEPGLERTVGHELQEAFTAMNAAVGPYPADERIQLDDRSLLAVRSHLDGFAFSHDERDWLGDAVEIFRSLTAKRLGGQFFTHPLVTQLAMDLLEFDPGRGDDLLDICAGTGGFLLTGARSSPSPPSSGAAGSGLGGVEADPELVRLANANLSMTVGEADAYVHVGDSLAAPDDWETSLRRAVVPGTHRCLASNPPFGTKITIKDKTILQQYELARRWGKNGGRWEVHGRQLSPRAPDILFIERNLQLAEPGLGRVALVTPYQVLSGPQTGFVRQWILRNARIRAVVDLPPTTFQPHTGTKTALLVLERREVPLETADAGEDYPIFMAVSEHIGHDRRGNPVFGNGSTEAVLEDVSQIATAFKAFRADGDPSPSLDNAFVTRSTEVLEESDLRINAAFYRPRTERLRRSLTDRAHDHGWETTTVGEVTESIFFPPRFKRIYVEREAGVPFLSGTNISQLNPTNPKYLAINDPRAEACIVRAGWILVTRSGSTGVISSVPPAWDGFAVSDHVIRIVPNASKLDPGFLQAYLRSAVGQELLRSGIFGSVIDEITPEHIASIPVVVPPPDELTPLTEAMNGGEAARDRAISAIQDAVARLEELLPH